MLGFAGVARGARISRHRGFDETDRLKSVTDFAPAVGVGGKLLQQPRHQWLCVRRPLLELACAEEEGGQWLVGRKQAGVLKSCDGLGPIPGGAGDASTQDQRGHVPGSQAQARSDPALGVIEPVALKSNGGGKLVRGWIIRLGSQQLTTKLLGRFEASRPDFKQRALDQSFAV